MTTRKGIVLAGGTGTRLYPVTEAVSKQLLPVYDKPMIYYPLSVLMLAGIRDILVITTSEDSAQFRRLLGDGCQWGISLSYAIQARPEGLAQAFVIAQDFLAGQPSALILGDNLYFGHGLPELLADACRRPGATVFGYRVRDPERYGVIDFDKAGGVRALVEKPKVPPSHFAVTGLYFVDATAPERARAVEPSARGELEIISVLESYLAEGSLGVKIMGRGFAWLDTGTFSSLLDAGNFVRTLSERQAQQIGALEEVAFLQGFISRGELLDRTKHYANTEYGSYLLALADS